MSNYALNQQFVNRALFIKALPLARKQPLNLRSKVAILLSIVAISILYILMVNNLAINGYRLRSLEKDKVNLLQENKNLELKIIQLQAVTLNQAVMSSVQLTEKSTFKYITAHVAEEIARK